MATDREDDDQDQPLREHCDYAADDHAQQQDHIAPSPARTCRPSSETSPELDSRLGTPTCGSRRLLPQSDQDS